MVDLEDKTLYEALGVSKDATQAEIRKAYHRLALQLHPDKHKGEAAAGATEKFQTLQKVYAILSNEEKRKVYDQTGSIEDSEELAGDKFNELYNYYRSMYAKVSEADLDAFYDSFRGSQEERSDLLKYYQQFNGDMAKVFEWVMCSDEGSDAHRFMDLIDAAVKAKEVPSFAKYAAWAKRVAARPRPAVGAAPGSGGSNRSKGGKKQQQQRDAEAALVAQIRGRQQAALQPFGGVLGKLMARYGGAEDAENLPAEPSEEEFQAAAQRLKLRGGGSGGGKQGGGKKAGGAGGSKQGKQKAAEAAGGSPSKRQRAKK